MMSNKQSGYRSYLAFFTNACMSVSGPTLGTLMLVYANYSITEIVHRFVQFLLYSLIVLHAPTTMTAHVKHWYAWTWEWRFTKPSDWLLANYRYRIMSNRVDVVLAHYKEDLGWLKPYLGKIDHLYLYCKDRKMCFKGLPSDLQGAQMVVEYLPNEGRETNTYLYHIIKNYHKLSPRTVFTLASLNGNWMRQLSFVFALTQSPHPKKYSISPHNLDLIRQFSFRSHTIVARSLGDGYRNAQDNHIVFAKFKPLEVWMYHYFGYDVFQSGFRYGEGQHGAIFSVGRAQISQYPLSLYQSLFRANSGADSMEAGYYMERIWRFMFATDLSK